ncbi:hypothetical protein H9C73_10415 [Marinobacterium sp. AK62]|uniref:Uncharacterized protein n=1 Tax=Marinobacterium alkalitolerans TaxID=1542925 RepID=A0ABS3ZBS5_9GAMM|nr:hypothetical protein [Marinobacterium alkalitolerans]MBP0049151.1 hypothetical protein [Marinobacterium alkalitolerans]
MSHANSLNELASQAEALRDSLRQTAKDFEQFEFNVSGVHDCMARIQKCVRMVGNDRKAALSHRDSRKVMAELEDAVNEMAELLNVDH